MIVGKKLTRMRVLIKKLILCTDIYKRNTEA